MSSVWSLGGWRHSMFGNSCCDCFGNSVNSSDISDAFTVHRRHRRKIIIMFICSSTTENSIFCFHLPSLRFYEPEHAQRHLVSAEETERNEGKHFASLTTPYAFIWSFSFGYRNGVAWPIETEAGFTRGERGVRILMFCTKIRIENDPWAPLYWPEFSVRRDLALPSFHEWTSGGVYATDTNCHMRHLTFVNVLSMCGSVTLQWK